MPHPRRPRDIRHHIEGDRRVGLVVVDRRRQQLAESVWPIMDLLEEIGGGASPNTARMPRASILSFSGVPVPCALT
jgi:hypothetical protein